MGDGRTKLKAVERNGRWTVRFAWPNGFTQFYGTFQSENDAVEWIAENRWMTAPKITERDIARHANLSQ